MDRHKITYISTRQHGSGYGYQIHGYAIFQKTSIQGYGYNILIKIKNILQAKASHPYVKASNSMVGPTHVGN
jgi:hypothetical protein